MKKIMILLAMVLSIATANALDFNDKVINKEQLPAQAQSFLNENFAEIGISYAKQETDFLERSYEVVLTDGTKLEFTGKGEWKDVDCRYGEVPSAIVPAPIKKYISEKYAGSKVLKIERDRRGYEVKLSNKLELTFNKDFRIVDIDD